MKFGFTLSQQIIIRYEAPKQAMRPPSANIYRFSLQFKIRKKYKSFVESTSYQFPIDLFLALESKRIEQITSKEVPEPS